MQKRKQVAMAGGGEKAIAKQKESGKLTARERIDSILDPGSFQELDLFIQHSARDFGMEKKYLAGDGVVAGTGTVNGRPVCIYAQDFTVTGGSLGFMHAMKICKVMDHAINLQMPLIGINDSGGARIQEGVRALAGYGEIFYRNTKASGVIPQLSVILGPCAGGAVVSKMFITGPEVIKSVLGEEISQEDLGGARTHAEITGNAHFYAKTEQECFAQIKELLGLIPHNNREKAQAAEPVPPQTSYKIEDIIPDDVRKPYDVRHIIRAISDNSQFLEVQELFAPNIVVGFGRMNGQTVGFVANQPLVMAGVLDVDSSDKCARFIRYCDAFNIPLVTFVDLPGYLPGVDQEHAGVIRHGAKILYAYSEASVPKITVILRKAYGGGYIAMCSKHLHSDFVYAWPTAEIAVMGSAGAANIIFRKEIKESENPEATRAEKVAEYSGKFANPYVAASYGYVDAVIDPAETRQAVANALNLSLNKHVETPCRKHGLPPF